MKILLYIPARRLPRAISSGEPLPTPKKARREDMFVIFYFESEIVCVVHYRTYDDDVRRNILHIKRNSSSLSHFSNYCILLLNTFKQFTIPMSTLLI